MKDGRTKNPKLTKQRRQVLDVIRDSDEHLTANEIFERARARLPGISFATVYNSVKFLKNEGLINEVSLGGGPGRFDPMTERHDHAICEDCGKLVDIHLEIPLELERKAVEISGFAASRIEMTLRGKCQNCDNS